jgi:hypothetical protein
LDCKAFGGEGENEGGRVRAGKTLPAFKSDWGDVAVDAERSKRRSAVLLKKKAK